ncbi:MAG: trigger factor [Erysipelotrichaceae bacterium]
MSSTWKLNEHSQGDLLVSVGGQEWKQAQKKAFNKLAKKVNLPGFRPGTAPENLVKKYVSKQNTLMEAIDEVASAALMKGIEEHSLQMIARPSLDVDKIDEEEVTLKFVVTVKPEVKLGDYKGLAIKKAAVKVSKAEIEEEAKKLQEKFAEMVIRGEDEAIENGDTAVIDFEGFKDDIAFEGGKGDNYPLEIGSNSFIPGFEEQLIGMKANETKDLNVSFPAEYQVEELAGQPVVFKVMVHEIKKKELPELNDELVKQAEIADVNNVEEYNAYLKKTLKEAKEKKADDEFTDKILTKICENCEVDIPEIMINEETDRMVEDFANRLKQQGFSLDQFKQVTGQSDEMIRGEVGKDAKQKVNVRLVLEAIGAAEEIEVSEQEIDDELTKISEIYQMDLNEIKKMIQNDAVSYDLKIRKTVDLIKNNAA